MDPAEERFVETVDASGDIITIRRRDPFGFCWLELESGKLPPQYQGAYTSVLEAKKAIEQYKVDKNIKKAK